MTETSISLLSIITGILGAVLLGALKSKVSFGITGNIIIGVFSSIFVIKTFGRLGFAPNHIMMQNNFHILLFVINMMVSALGGVLGLLLATYLHQKANQLKK